MLSSETFVHKRNRNRYPSIEVKSIFLLRTLVYIVKFFSFSSKAVNRVRLAKKTNCIEKNKIKVDYITRENTSFFFVFFFFYTNKIMNYFSFRTLYVRASTHTCTYLLIWQSYNLQIESIYLNSLSFCIRQRIKHSSIEHQ